MIDLDAFKVPSIMKKMIFFMISFFSGVCTLFFISPENFLVFGAGMFLSLSAAMVLSTLFHSRYLLLILPLFFWGMAGFMNTSDLGEWGLILIGVGVFFMMNSFYTAYKEKINLSFFRDSFSAFKSGGVFILLGLGILIFSSSSSLSSGENPEFSKIITQKILESEQVHSLINTIMNPDILEKQLLEAQKVCRGNTQCLNTVARKFETEKIKAQNQLEVELEKNITKFTSPEAIENFIAEKNIPYIGNISVENLQILVLFILAFFALLPLVPLFAVLGATFFSLFFLTLVCTGQILLGKVSVKKEILY